MTETIFAPPLKKKLTQPRRVSLEAYFKSEEKSMSKHEYHDGIITPTAGGKLQHNQLATIAAKLMDNFVEDNNLNFIVSNSDTKIRIEDYNKIVYPDAVVIFEAPEYYEGRLDTILNPIIIIEILSDSTKNFDKTTKFEMYRTVPSFKEYVLVHQNRRHASVFTKQNDGTWLLKDYDGDDAAPVLYALHNCPLPLNRLYRGLK